MPLLAPVMTTLLGMGLRGSGLGARTVHGQCGRTRTPLPRGRPATHPPRPDPGRSRACMRGCAPRSRRSGTARRRSADLMPSVLASLGVPGEPNPLGLPEAARTVVLLVDGMGWELLRRHPDAAPFLTALAGRPLTAGFPSTTGASLASLGTGLPPGAHGLTGYTSWVEEVGRDGRTGWAGSRSARRRRTCASGSCRSSCSRSATAFERAVDAGVEVTVVSAAQFAGSGLTRAVLRGGRYAGSVTPGDARRAGRRGAAPGRPQPRLLLHRRPRPHRARPRAGDRRVARPAARWSTTSRASSPGGCPPTPTLLVTADHGMVTVADGRAGRLRRTPALSDGVPALAGEPRVRHVHAEPGAARRACSPRGGRSSATGCGSAGGRTPSPPGCSARS